MSRRETAVYCAVGIFLALLTTGCERRTDAPPKRRLETADRGAATEITWGQAVSGLQAGLEIKGRHFETGAPICAVIHVRNLGQKEIKLYDAAWKGSWSVVFRSHLGDAPMRACRLVRDDHPAMNVAVPTGAEREAVCLIMAAPTWRFLELPEARASTSALSSGGYTVTASYSFLFGEPAPTPFREYWRGKVTSGAVNVEIVAKPVAVHPRSSPSTKRTAVPTTEIQIAKRRCHFLDWDFCTDNSNNSAVDESKLKKGHIYFVGLFDERGLLTELHYYDRGWEHRWTKRFAYGGKPSPDSGPYMPYTYKYYGPDGKEVDHLGQEEAVAEHGEGWHQGTSKEEIRKVLGEPLVISTDSYGMEKWKYFDGVSQHWFAFDQEGRLDYSNYLE